MPVYLFSDGDGTIEFYVQLQLLTNMTSSNVDVIVELHRVVYTQTDDVTRSAVIHSHRVSDVTYLRYLLVQLGGICYGRRDLLCWAPVDSVLCARLSRSEGRLKDVQTVVNTTQVEQICQGNQLFINLVLRSVVLLQKVIYADFVCNIDKQKNILHRLRRLR